MYCIPPLFNAYTPNLFLSAIILSPLIFPFQITFNRILLWKYPDLIFFDPHEPFAKRSLREWGECDSLGFISLWEVRTLEIATDSQKVWCVWNQIATLSTQSWRGSIVRVPGWWLPSVVCKYPPEMFLLFPFHLAPMWRSSMICSRSQRKVVEPGLLEWALWTPACCKVYSGWAPDQASWNWILICCHSLGLCRQEKKPWSEKL